MHNKLFEYCKVKKKKLQQVHVCFILNIISDCIIYIVEYREHYFASNFRILFHNFHMIIHNHMYVQTGDVAPNSLYNEWIYYFPLCRKYCHDKQNKVDYDEVIIYVQKQYLTAYVFMDRDENIPVITFFL